MLTLDYRPKNFADLIGQEHVVLVLKSILKLHDSENRGLPAGLLFSGQRGTGKTTTARIIAAALNCLNHNSSELEPCGVCANCVSIQKTNCMFVYEVDAASTGTVDEIRKIKDLTRLHHSGNVRVIILDEAHSLTSQAFEALLKQLEEPFADTLYVLCTTERDKFPETILSRLMQFDFKQITSDIIAKRLNYISSRESILIADNRVVPAIADRARGSMRDAIMMLEQLRHVSSQLTLENFLSYYGLVNVAISRELIICARTGDIVKAKSIIETHLSSTVDVGYFIDGFMQSIAGYALEKIITNDEAIKIYRVAIEVKSKLKYMLTEAAINFLFVQLIGVFYRETSSIAGPVTVQEAESIFK